MKVSFEELLVALSDNLWKGIRVGDLELRIVDEAALLVGIDRWEIYMELDSAFEDIASGGLDRLNRSK